MEEEEDEEEYAVSGTLSDDLMGLSLDYAMNHSNSSIVSLKVKKTNRNIHDDVKHNHVKQHHHN